MDACEVCQALTVREFGILVLRRRFHTASAKSGHWYNGKEVAQRLRSVNVHRCARKDFHDEVVKYMDFPLVASFRELTAVRAFAPRYDRS